MSNYKGKDKHNNADNQSFKANKANFTVHFILDFQKHARSLRTPQRYTIICS